MQRSQKFAVILAALLFTGTTTAQTPYQDFSKKPRVYTNRKSFWYEGNFNGTIKKNKEGQMKWQYQLDWQYRRSGDANYVKGGDQYNILKDMSQHVLRPWIHFYPQPGKVRLSVSPVGHWGTWTPKAEGTGKYFTEYRSSLQVTLYQKLGRAELQQRYRFEYRWISSKKDASYNVSEMISNNEFTSKSFRNRFRYMLRMNYPLTKSGNTYLALWDEVFIGMGKNVPSNKILDQNRLIALLGRKMNTSRYPMKLEIGLTWQSAPKFDLDVPPTQASDYGSFQKNNWENNLCLQVYLIFDEFHKMGFKKK